MPAPIVHIELPSADFGRTTEFYGQLFGWQTQQNATATYMKFDGDDGPSGGWVRADMVQSPGPIPYVAVDDLAKTLEKVERAGGKIVVRSMAFAGGGEVALVADPDGNVVGVWMRKREGGKAAAPAKAAVAKAAPVAKPAKAAPKPAAGRRPAKRK
ncbi:MAG TPA: VOC family protein [Polyangia bacterium]|nr:VOC family protein [Polyangia bacterium]